MTKLIDRNGTPLAVGQRVRIKVCVGRYGQTAIREGELVDADGQFCGVTIKTANAFTEDRGRLGIQHHPAGSLAYVVVPPQGYEKFDDFEHGHETWVEVVP